MCILVVEDDFLIRMILVEELLDAGYEVREAESGDHALDLLDGIDPPLELLVTDIHMPGAHSGIEVAALVRERLPQIPIIFTTGRPDALIQNNSLKPGHYLIRKPYVPAEIISRIRQLLA
jgi:CheY-like chemotaxis protein